MSRLDTLRELGLLGPLDVRFAAAMVRLGEVDDEDVALGAALASRALSVGDVGVDLRAIWGTLSRAVDDQELPAFPETDAWRSALASAQSIVRRPHETRSAPLVLAGADLYLERTWVYQQRLATAVRARLHAPPHPVDMVRLFSLLTQLQFSDARSVLQNRAIVTAAHRGLAIIAGGPGTGKTAVVLKLLAVLQELEKARTGRPLRVRLVAPTGKAAARMSESIRQRAAAWVPAHLRAAVQKVEASTIHRLLGWRGTTFQHHADNPLACDLLIVDEASMVDLPLMTKLLEAVPTDARVLLLGDADQLGSVAVGSVFADLCRATSGPVSKPLREAWIATGCDVPSRPSSGDRPLPGDALTVLTHTWRYAPGSGIEALARWVNAGDAKRALEVLRDADWADVQLVEVPESQVAQRLETLVLDTTIEVAGAGSAIEALQRLRAIRVLGAHRAGRGGVTELNAHLERRVRDELGVEAGIDWFAGRPVMVTRNDHDLQLFNGDVGVAFGSPDSPMALRVWFETPDGVGRAVSTAVLPEHDTVFATTVHKSQGSEYEHVVLVLPTRASPMLTRELLYTAVTRATSRVTILGSSAVLEAAIDRPTERMSRLAMQLSRPVERTRER